MEVDLTTLPIAIQRQIPMSLRSYSNIHILEELPVTVQYIIRNYFEKTYSVNYDVCFDTKPDISKYNDFITIDNVTDLVVEYLKNYLVIVPESYPFDPQFGCRLKYQIQTRDINLRQTLITAEINNIVKAVSIETGSNVIVENVEIIPVSTGSSTEYNAVILLKINNDQRKKINLEFMG